MRKLFIPAIAAFVLIGCAENWQKPGASEQDLAAVESVCQDRAYARFPSLYRYTLDGGRYRTPLIVPLCNRENPVVACQTRQGDYVFPSMVTSDENLDARWNDFDACMSENGWKPVP